MNKYFNQISTTEKGLKQNTKSTENYLKNTSENNPNINTNEVVKDLKTQDNMRNISANAPLYPTSTNQVSDDNEEVLYTNTNNIQDTIPFSGIGSLVVQAFSAEQAIPLENVKITITSNEPQTKHIHEILYTNISGRTESVSLPTPSLFLSNQSQNDVRPYAVYNVSGEKDGYTYVNSPKQVIVFDKIESIQNIELIPKRESD